MTTETRDFETFVRERFGGRLYRGAHDPNGKACVNEALNVYLGHSWGDGGFDLDLRGLNDGPWSSDEARTAGMLPLGPVILAFQSWTPARRQEWAKAVAEGVIRRILPPTLRRVAELIPASAPSLVAAALRCETEGSESAARSAAESAAWSAESAARSAAESAAWSAAESAESAARSAESAAWSAAESARSDKALQTLCEIMVSAAAVPA